MDSNYNTIRYQHTFLSQVIARIDFRNYIDSKELFCDEILDEIRSNFPRQSMTKAINFSNYNIELHAGSEMAPSIMEETKSGLSKEFASADRTSKLTLTNKFLVIEFNNYSSYTENFDVVKKIVGAILNNRSITTDRIGMRYINLFDVEKVKISKSLFRKPIADALYYKDEKIIAGDMQIIRTMNMSEYCSGNSILNIRYGFYNPEYPSKMNKNDFALDFDYFTQEPMNRSIDIAAFFDRGHITIQSTFESYISDKLRERMGG